MAYEIVLAPEATEDLRGLKANARAAARRAIETQLRHEPGKTSRSRINRLRGLRQPQYRLRVGEARVFYDVSGSTVEILAIVTKSEAEAWLRQFGVRREAGSAIRDRGRPLAVSAREAEGEEIVITGDGKPAGLLIGFASEEDWLDYRLENDPRFLRRIEQARQSLRAGGGVRIEDVG